MLSVVLFTMALIHVTDMEQCSNTCFIDILLRNFSQESFH